MARVWDRFLTEQDKAHLAKRRRSPRGFGRRPALLCIDLYRGVFGDRPEPLVESIDTWPGSCGPAAWDAIAPTQALQRAARTAGIPIFHTTGMDDGAGLAWMKQQRYGNVEAAERDRRKYDLIPETGPEPGEVIIRKSSPSPFWGTPLVGYLNGLGIDTVITCGETTSGCVRAAFIDGCTYRYGMVGVEEAIFDRHEASHAINLFDINEKYGDILSLEDVLAYLHSIPDGAGRLPE